MVDRALRLFDRRPRRACPDVILTLHRDAEAQARRRRATEPQQGPDTKPQQTYEQPNEEHKTPAPSAKTNNPSLPTQTKQKQHTITRSSRPPSAHQARGASPQVSTTRRGSSRRSTAALF